MSTRIHTDTAPCSATRRLVAAVLAVMLCGSIHAFGQAAAKPKAADDSDAKSTKSDAKSKKSDEKPSEKGGFGSARKADAKKERPSEEEREKAKLRKAVERRLGTKKEGFFVFVTQEKIFQISQPPADVPSKDQNAPNNRNANPRQQVEQVVKHDVLVLEGRDRAADYLVQFLSEYPPPDSKSRSRKQKSDEPVSLPDPIRSWEFVRWFKEGEEGNRAAHDVQQQVQDRLNQAEARAASR